MRPSRTSIGLAAVVLLVVAVACSSERTADQGTSGQPGGSSEVAAFVSSANAICRDGKSRTAAVPLSVDVVPHPNGSAQTKASTEWARATADEMQTTADHLRALAVPSGDEVLGRLTPTYQSAVDRLRREGSAVLADPNFLADRSLFDAGLDACFAAPRT